MDCALRSMGPKGLLQSELSPCAIEYVCIQSRKDPVRAIRSVP